MTIALLGFSFILVLANAILLAINLRRYAQLVALNGLLQRLCVRAFMLRHCAIWLPWSAMTGIDFKIIPVQRERAQRGLMSD